MTKMDPYLIYLSVSSQNVAVDANGHETEGTAHLDSLPYGNSNWVTNIGLGYTQTLGLSWNIVCG